ncbi:MAG: substrate-binding domain-containing protein [Bacteroidota bacterium]
MNRRFSPSLDLNLSLYLCLFLFLLLPLSSCTRKDSSRPSKTIGVSLLTRGHMFYRDLEEGLKGEAAKNNYELIIAAAEFDLGKQISQIEDFVSRKVDVIILCPVDSKGVGPGIKEANKAGIPVFTADITAEEGTVVCHVASNNLAGGNLAGEYLAKVLKGKGNIAIINQPVVTSVLDRVQGFREAIAKYPNMKIVADVNGEGVRDKSLQAASDILQANPKLDGIFGINDESALGALDAVQQFKRTSVAIVGYDATPPAVDAIKKGTALKADVMQHPKNIGMTTIQKIHDYLSGSTVPKVVPVEVEIVDKEMLGGGK